MKEDQVNESKNQPRKTQFPTARTKEGEKVIQFVRSKNVERKREKGVFLCSFYIKNIYFTCDEEQSVHLKQNRGTF